MYFPSSSKVPMGSGSVRSARAVAVAAVAAPLLAPAVDGSGVSGPGAAGASGSACWDKVVPLLWIDGRALGTPVLAGLVASGGPSARVSGAGAHDGGQG
jgi:hypothetical protein